MAETYEKDAGGQLKVITTTETVIDLKRLKEEREHTAQMIAREEERYTRIVTQLTERLATIDKRIAEAEKLGIKEI